MVAIGSALKLCLVAEGAVDVYPRFGLDPRVACRELIRAAHHGGGKDNITSVLIVVP